MDRRYGGRENTSDSDLNQQPHSEYRPNRSGPDPSPPSSFRGHGAEKPSTWKVVAKILPRWLMIVVIAFIFYGVLVYYQGLPVMTKTQKRIFNSASTGLSIGLGIAVASSLDGMVGDLRWWILSRRFRSRHKVENILQADSLVPLLKLAYRTRRKSIHIAVLLWGLMLLGSQVAVASIGLCYSTDANEKVALMEPGNTVFIPNLSSIKAGENETPGAEYMANNYGIISTAAIPGDNFSAIPKEKSIVRAGETPFYCEGVVCRYVFKELSIDPAQQDDESIISVTTKRTIDATTRCNGWPIVAGGDGSGKSISVAMPQGNTNVSIPVRVGISATLYMRNTSQTCGNGCSQLSAFEASSTAPWYYQCNTTLGPVVNDLLPEHRASNNLTILLAGAIALQGYAASSFAEDPVLQYQTYPSESFFGSAVNGTTDGLAHIISRFTIGAMAAFADNNNFVQVPGEAPRRGIELNITHPSIILFIFLLIIGMTLTLEIAMAVWANRVVLPPDSPLAVAQVLREMTMQRPHTQLRSYPSSSGGKSLTDRKGEPLWIFRCVERPEVGMYDLYMEGSDSRLIAQNDIEMTEPDQSARRN
ncbi:hypothetical protein PGQ11_000771 [Apiospora arundinis]